VACLYYVSGTAMSEIERVVTQFGGAFDGAAGPIRSVASRTCDVLPMVARVAELLHSGLDLSARIGRLVIRLEYGVASEAVDIARHAGRDLGRGDYRRLVEAGLASAEAIDSAQDATILDQVDNNSDKLRAIRVFAENARSRRKVDAAPMPSLDPYQG
jgi:helicase